MNSITYPSTRVVQQNYDAIGRVCAVGTSGSTCSTGTTYATGFSYNPAFQVTGFNYGNGVTAAIGYTPDRLLLQSLAYTKGATSLFSTNYWYKTDSTNCPSGASGNNGQIQCITDSVDAGRNATYTYDSLYRLTRAVTAGSANYPAWGLSETYDRYGNRWAQSTYSGCTGITCPTNSVGVDAPTNHINSGGYGYDANGNMTNDGANTLVYDAENRVLSATNGGGSGTYTYDGNNLRVKKVSGSTTTVYILSGSKVIAEYDNGAAVGSPSREYIYSGGALLAKIDSSGTKYYHQDHLSNRLVTDSSGNKVAELGHFPFGESWYNSSGDKLLFTTYERDAESGNDYAMMRSYVNRLAGFSSPDLLNGSFGNPQSLDRYSYTRSAPVDLSDPRGMMPRMYVCGGSGDPVHIDCFGWGFAGGGGGGSTAIFGNDLFDALIGSPGATLIFDMFGNLHYGFSSNSLILSLEKLDGFDCSDPSAPCDQALNGSLPPTTQGVSMDPGFTAQTMTPSAGSGVANLSWNFQLPPYPGLPVTARPVFVRPSTLRPPAPGNAGQSGSPNYYNTMTPAGVNLHETWELLMEVVLEGNLSYVP